MLRVFSLCLVSFLFLKCNLAEDNNISGIWELTNSENCSENFLGLLPFVYPYAKYGHKIYIHDSLFYNPSMREKGLPFENWYDIEGENLLLEGIGQIGFTVKDSILTLEKEECKLTFVKQIEYETLSKDNLLSISFYVSDDEGVLVDSLCLQKTTSNAYIFRMAESIAKENLNNTFDEKVLDANKYEIFLEVKNGESFRIISYGKYETPFEVQILIKYLGLLNKND